MLFVATTNAGFTTYTITGSASSCGTCNTVPATVANCNAKITGATTSTSTTNSTTNATTNQF